MKDVIIKSVADALKKDEPNGSIYELFAFAAHEFISTRCNETEKNMSLEKMIAGIIIEKDDAAESIENIVGIMVHTADICMIILDVNDLKNVGSIRNAFKPYTWYTELPNIYEDRLVFITKPAEEFRKIVRFEFAVPYETDLASIRDNLHATFRGTKDYINDNVVVFSNGSPTYTNGDFDETGVYMDLVDYKEPDITIANVKDAINGFIKEISPISSGDDIDG